MQTAKTIVVCNQKGGVGKTVTSMCLGVTLGKQGAKVLLCENGYAASKDLPYGTYTVHQTKGHEGHELIPDFDVFISEDGKTYR